jgi:hypothetical protein
MAEIFSHPFRLTHLKDAKLQIEVAADARSRTALAALYGLPALAALRGIFTLERGAGGIIAARLRLHAELTQTCVVTLEPFASVIEETAALAFVPAARIPEGEDAGELTAETLEGPDEIPYAGESIDLGAALAEQLALALDPYPRRPGVVLPAAADDASGHPFALLAARKADPG